MQLRKNEKWTIAYRKRAPGKTLLDDTQSVFTPVPNTWRYWRADPFLFERDGKTYLFAELFDRIKGRGVLGCCELSSHPAPKWEIIIEEPHHLSYPFLFQRSDGIYLIPESFESGKLTLYRAIRFPDKWERVRNLADMVAVDSTIVDTASGSYLITVRIENGDAELAVMDLNSQLEPKNVRVVSEKGNPNVRPAGNLFSLQDRLIRPAQDCTRSYGYGLNFYHVSALDQVHYCEELICKVLPEDVHVRGIRKLHGIHTYNFTDRYEVIDFKVYEFGIVGKIAKVLRYLTGRSR